MLYYKVKIIVDNVPEVLNKCKRKTIGTRTFVGTTTPNSCFNFLKRGWLIGCSRKFLCMVERFLNFDLMNGLFLWSSKNFPWKNVTFACLIASTSLIQFPFIFKPLIFCDIWCLLTNSWKKPPFSSPSKAQLALDFCWRSYSCIDQHPLIIQLRFHSNEIFLCFWVA